MTHAADRMRQRKSLVEHPFGTLKCRAGYRHFLVRGFDKVRGEWSLMALCYNFRRVLSILGLQGFMTYLARRAAARAILCALLAIIRRTDRASARVARIQLGLGRKFAMLRLRLRPA